MMLCYCGSGQIFSECCQPYLTGEHSAPSAEALMRSRYSAFCVADMDYLLSTHKSAEPLAQRREQLQKTFDQTTWLGLQVLANDEKQDKGSVEFVAYYRDLNGVVQLHEKSAFIRDQGKWLYTEGEHLPPLKHQRNDPCWCGSGQKFKKCCGK